MEILKAMSIKTNEFSKGLILRGLCRLHTAVPYVFEVVSKNDKYYLCVMDPQYVGASLVGELSDNYCICDYEEITDLTVKGVFNKIIYFINYYNKEDGLDKQLAYI
jgi:hypothetical protein